MGAEPDGVSFSSFLVSLVILIQNKEIKKIFEGKHFS